MKKRNVILLSYKHIHTPCSRANICGRYIMPYIYVIDHYSAKKLQTYYIKCWYRGTHIILYIYVSKNMSGGVRVDTIRSVKSLYIHIVCYKIFYYYAYTRKNIRLLCAIRANSERFKNYDVVIGCKIIWKCNSLITISICFSFFFFFSERIMTTAV